MTEPMLPRSLVPRAKMTVRALQGLLLVMSLAVLVLLLLPLEPPPPPQGQVNWGAAVAVAARKRRRVGVMCILGMGGVDGQEIEMTRRECVK